MPTYSNRETNVKSFYSVKLFLLFKHLAFLFISPRPRY
jgi:hypothetical protein